MFDFCFQCFFFLLLQIEDNLKIDNFFTFYFCDGLTGSLRSPRQRRQRTTSINLTTTIDVTESIIRANNRTIYTAGRPPWYNFAGQQVEPFVIGVLI